MADIDVVPKHRSYTWLWVLLAIVVIAMLIWVVGGRSHAAASVRLAPDYLAGLQAAARSFQLPV
jgi:hypothetical protein